MINRIRAWKRKLNGWLKKHTLYGRLAATEKKVKSLEEKIRLLEKENQQLTKRIATSNERMTKKVMLHLQEMAKMTAKVCAKTGWNPAAVEARYYEARNLTGCEPKEFYMFHMYDMTDEELEATLVESIQQSLQKKYDVNKAFVAMLKDKEATNRFFAEYVKRPWCVNTRTSFEDFSRIFADTHRIIYKPIKGNCGRGIEAFDLTADTLQQVYTTLCAYPEGVVEQYVIQHPEMLKLCPSSVNTVRIVTFSSNTAPVTQDGKYMDIAYSSLRIGGGNSVVDNFHSGGMTSNIDIETGTLITNAADMACNVFQCHPSTGVVFKGFQIPYFEEALSMVKEAIAKYKVEGYLGWDVAITENGPDLIEVNSRPGIVLLSTPYAYEKKGMRHVLAKYL